MIFLTDRRSARHEQYIRCAGTHRLAHRLTAIWDQRRDARLAAVAPHQSGQHHRVTIDNTIAFWFSADRQQFIAGDEDVNARPANRGHFADADRGEQSKILRTQYTADRQHGAARFDVLAASPDVAARRYRFGDTQHPRLFLSHLDGYH